MRKVKSIIKIYQNQIELSQENNEIVSICLTGQYVKQLGLIEI
jgi:hypothetical protein